MRPSWLPHACGSRPIACNRAASLRVPARRRRAPIQRRVMEVGQRRPGARSMAFRERFLRGRAGIVPRSHIAGPLRERLAPWITTGKDQVASIFCTGSGCLAIVLARSFPAARIDATDISRPASRCARRNVRQNYGWPGVRLLESIIWRSEGPPLRFDRVQSAVRQRQPACGAFA